METTQTILQSSAPSTQRTIVEIRHMNKWYDEFKVLTDINLTVQDQVNPP
jgi:ABC-type phosphate transport system ATPase subunit